MTVATTYDMRYITRVESAGCWYIRVGLYTDYCKPKQLSDVKYKGKYKSLKAAKIYRDKQEKLLKLNYGISFNLGYDPNKESLNLNVQYKESGTYWNWIASVWCTKTKIQFKKTYSVNKYGARQAKKMAREWRDNKRNELYGKRNKK